MPGLHLYTSNRLEILQQNMAMQFRTSPLPALQKEIVVVQSRGMERWLNLETARQNGICAHVEYLFPRVFVYQLFRQVIELPEASPFAPEINTWRILQQLPRLLALPEAESLSHYVKEDPSGLKRYQLAQKIAEAFDRYTIMRPEMVTAWDEGRNPLQADLRESRWQAALWQMLLETDAAQSAPPHHAALKKIFLEEPDPSLDLPGRVSVFGISALPPFYLDIFKKISRRIDIDIYYLNPCREYWEYAYSAKQIARFAEAGFTEDDTYYDCGNSLLASLGSAGREFFSLVLNSIGDTGTELFVRPEGGTLLAAVQSDILKLQEHDPAASPPVTDTDTSIRVHACHSPFREVEVLHDQLLDLFAENASLKPTDIVVMMPDVVAYAPLIQAVFDSRASAAQRIPYSIADTRMRGTNPLADTFLAILAISRKRYRAPAVLDILETAAVRGRFGIDANGLERIKKWVNDTGICWGIDGDYRANLDLPGFQANTWKFGLERMLLGYALPPGDHSALFADILPYGDIEGDDAHLLGAFTHFVHTLFTFAESLDRPRPLSNWADKLLELLACFFIQDTSTENDIEQIRATLTDSGLAGFAAAADLKEPLSREVISAYLEKRIGGDALTFGFISYGVTFCTLLPMRSIPFKVVCLLGMNDGEYPRTHHPPGFDLMEKGRRLCDWSKRQEDRYLFLESILSARQHLIISYVGRSLKDNSDLPPSVLVSELLDYLEAGYKTGDDQPLAKRLITRHPLQPFSHRYFEGDRHLFSYSEQNCKAARQNQAAKTMTGNFPDQPLAPPAAGSWQSVSVRQFCRFFNNPVEFMVNNRLKVNYQVRAASLPEEREPFELDALQAYWIKDEMVALNLAAAAPKPVAERLKASGRLPHGHRGDLVLSDYQQEVETFTRSVKPYLTGGPAEPQEVGFTSSREPATTLQGILDTLYPGGQLFYRCAPLKPKDRLNAWIHHLLLSSREKGPVPRETILLGKDNRAAFKPLEPAESRAALEDLVGFFRNGLEIPLCFFPKTSYAFAEAVVVKGKPADRALQAAKSKWDSGYHYTGESENIYRRRSFGSDMPESPDFQETALAIFRPLFAAMTEQPLG